MLHFIYRDALDEDELLASKSSSCELSSSLVSETLTEKVLAAANKYNLMRLRRVCEHYICKDITVDSVARVLALADRYHATELKAICLKFAAENLSGTLRRTIFSNVICIWIFIFTLR